TVLSRRFFSAEGQQLQWGPVSSTGNGPVPFGKRQAHTAASMGPRLIDGERGPCRRGRPRPRGGFNGAPSHRRGTALAMGARFRSGCWRLQWGPVSSTGNGGLPWLSTFCRWRGFNGAPSHRRGTGVLIQKMKFKKDCFNGAPSHRRGTVGTPI